jgi:hypothetical protein
LVKTPPDYGESVIQKRFETLSGYYKGTLGAVLGALLGVGSQFEEAK